MKLIYYSFTGLFILFLGFIFTSNSSGRATAAGAGNTGAPGYGVAFNVVSGGTPAGYGFQATALDGSNNKAGDFSNPIAGTQIATAGAREYAEHVGVSPMGAYGWQWTAPAAGTGSVTFYGIGNAVNGTGNTSGDVGNTVPVTITLTEGVAMPISLAEFTAEVEKQSVSLNWTTDMEENTNYFEIERSKDGRYFEAIGKIAAAGDSEESIDYSFTDERPNSINYYRLKSVDLDESFTNSKIISANIGETQSGINLFPHPVLNTATVDLELATSGDYKMSVYNILGQLMQTKIMSIVENESISFNANKLQTGLYIIEFEGNGRKFVREFIKR